MPDPVFQDPGPVEQSVQLDVTYDVVGDITLPTDVDNLNMAGGPYLAWAQVTKFATETGWFLNTIQGDPSGVGLIGDFINPLCPRIEKIVAGLAIRARDEPQLPTPDPDTDTRKLHSAETLFFDPSLMPAATRLYGVVWLYRYNYSKVPGSDEAKWSRAPFDGGAAQPANVIAFVSWMLGH